MIRPNKRPIKNFEKMEAVEKLFLRECQRLTSLVQQPIVLFIFLIITYAVFSAPLLQLTANSNALTYKENFYLITLWVFHCISIAAGIFYLILSVFRPQTHSTISSLRIFCSTMSSIFFGLLYIFQSIISAICLERPTFCSRVEWVSSDSFLWTEGTFIVVLFQPMLQLLVFSFSDLSFSASLGIFSWIISVLALTITEVLVQSRIRLAITVTYIALSFVFLPILIIQISTFNSIDVCCSNSITDAHQHEEVEAEIKSRIETAVCAKSTEMRHLIANVAHDLKTPLSSFMVGVDLIKQIILYCEEQLDQRQKISADDLMYSLQSIGDYISDIKNTNTFMVMTINRVLDYAKATKGVKLVPKLETINMREAISLPIQCMKNVQDKVLIQCEALTDEICSHIITDNQWLQENLLCLLSNAAKYSSGGTVTISIRLVDKQPESRAIQHQESDSSGNSLMSSRSADTTTPRDEDCERGDEEKTSLESATIRVPLYPILARKVDKIQPVQSTAPLAAEPVSTSFANKALSSLPFFDRIANMFRFKNLITPISGSVFDINSAAAVDDGCDDVEAQPHQSLPNKTNQNCNTSNSDHSDTSILQLMLATDHSAGEGPGSPMTPSASSYFTVRGKPPDHRYLLIEVEDTGIGMTDEAMSSLFNPFKQNQKLAGGTGLGLFSLAQRVDALKGRYGVRHRRDGTQGSLFWFTMPYRPDDIAADEEMRVCRRAQRLQLLQLEQQHHSQQQSMPMTTQPRLMGHPPLSQQFSTALLSPTTHSANTQSISSSTSMPGVVTCSGMLTVSEVNALDIIHLTSTGGEDAADMSAIQEDTKPSSSMLFSTRNAQLNVSDTMRPQKLRMRTPETAVAATAIAACGTEGPHVIHHTNQSPPLIPSLRTPNQHPLLHLKTKESPYSRMSPHEAPPMYVHHNLHHVAPSPTVTSANSATANSVTKSVYNVLLAEDSPTLVKAQSMMLRRQGHRVHIAENGAIALRMYEESLDDELTRYDFILMDLQMPVMDGLEAIKRIRAKETSRPVRCVTNTTSAIVARSSRRRLSHLGVGEMFYHQFIIAVSADCSEEIIEEVHQIGADGFLAKPFSVAEFESLADELLFSRRGY